MYVSKEEGFRPLSGLYSSLSSINPVQSAFSLGRFRPLSGLYSSLFVTEKNTTVFAYWFSSPLGVI